MVQIQKSQNNQVPINKIFFTELTETLYLRIFDIVNFSSQKVLRLGTLALVEL